MEKRRESLYFGTFNLKDFTSVAVNRMNRDKLLP